MNAIAAPVQAARARRPAEWSPSLGCMYHLKGITDAAIVSIEAHAGVATLTAYRAGCAAPFYRQRFLSVIEAMDAGEDLATRYGFWSAQA